MARAFSKSVTRPHVNWSTSSVYDACSDSATLIACSSIYSSILGSSYKSRLRLIGGFGGGGWSFADGKGSAVVIAVICYF